MVGIGALHCEDKTQKRWKGAVEVRFTGGYQQHHLDFIFGLTLVTRRRSINCIRPAIVTSAVGDKRRYAEDA